MKISKHAYKRARERLSFSAGTLARVAEKAFKEGKVFSDFKGAFRKFLLAEKTKQGAEVRVYGHVLYFFSPQNLLITVLIVPERMKGVYEKCLKKH